MEAIEATIADRDGDLELAVGYERGWISEDTGNQVGHHTIGQGAKLRGSSTVASAKRYRYLSFLLWKSAAGIPSWRDCTEDVRDDLRRFWGLLTRRMPSEDYHIDDVEPRASQWFDDNILRLPLS